MKKQEKVRPEIRASTAIVGAGPAGLLAAIAHGAGALLLERNPDAGRKLLVSGAGQCNFSNNLSREDFLRACGRAANFLKPAIYQFGNEDFISLLAEAGCPTLIREDGKAFPASLRAADLRDALVRQVLARGARLQTGVYIVDARRDGDFILTARDGRIIRCSRLILAGGGCSWPQTGSDGSVYDLARALGHSIVEPSPALASIDVEDYAHFRDCAGISLRDVNAVFRSARGRHEARGDLLWTHTGLSGPLILDNSHHLDRGDSISLCLLPGAEEKLPRILRQHPRHTLLNALKFASLPESLIRALLQHQGIESGQVCAQLSRPTRKRLVALLTSLRLKVSRIESLKTCMSTAGGVPLAEVRAKSMESALCPGLFLAGELLDYSLPSGGFNIQAAASTGYLAGRQKIY